MRAVRLSILIASSVVLFEQVSVAQTSPPPGYQQPPPGYQQQQPPGYQQPPPGYQQQPPPGYQQPPPGYQQPPPAGYQQPGYYQQPPTAYQPPPPGYAAAPPPPRGKHGFLALPYLGFESHRGENVTGLGAGFIMGTLLGGRVNEMFSINGEFRLDFLNPKNLPTGQDIQMLELDLAVSPLFHIPLPAVGEFVVGPKLGLYGESARFTYGGAETMTVTASGFVAGVNAGMFFDISRSVALGGMLSLSVRDAGEVCTTPTGGSENCDSMRDYESETVIGFHAGALF